MKNQVSFQTALHHLMALSGGFMGGYALFSRADVFGSSQTANMIMLVSAILGRSPSDVLLRVGALLCYVFGVALSEWLLHRTRLHNLHILSILLDIAALIVLGMTTEAIHPVLALYPFFFVTAFQWCSFGSINGYSSSTIFSTNNLRQTVAAFTNYCCTKNRKQLEKSLFFGGTLLFYHCGAALSWFAYHYFGAVGAWIGILPLLLNLGLAGHEWISSRAVDDWDLRNVKNKVLSKSLSND